MKLFVTLNDLSYHVASLVSCFVTTCSGWNVSEARSHGIYMQFRSGHELHGVYMGWYIFYMTNVVQGGLSVHDRRGLIEINAEIKGWRSKWKMHGVRKCTCGGEGISGWEDTWAVGRRISRPGIAWAVGRGISGEGDAYGGWRELWGRRCMWGWRGIRPSDNLMGCNTLTMAMAGRSWARASSSSMWD